MRRFKAGEFDVLVSTTVIEVGHRRAERDRDRDRARRALRAGAAPPAARARRPRPRAGPLLPRGAGLDWRRRPTSGCACSSARPTASRIAEADLAAARARATSSARGRRGCRRSASRTCCATRRCCARRATRRRAWLAHDPDLSRPESGALRAVLRHRWAGGSIWRRSGEASARNSRARRYTAACRTSLLPAPRARPRALLRSSRRRLPDARQRGVRHRRDLLLSQLPRGGAPRSRTWSGAFVLLPLALRRSTSPTASWRAAGGTRPSAPTSTRWPTSCPSASPRPCWRSRSGCAAAGTRSSCARSSAAA